MSNDIKEVGAEFDMKVSQEKETVPKLLVKPRIPIEEIPEDLRGKPLTQENIENLVEMLKSRLDPNATAQLVERKNLVVTDFKNLTQEDVYNPDIYFEAKPFMNSDFLKVTLKDREYEPRWVNKKSERLGHMIAIGFTYVEKQDLEQRLEVEISNDAEGHFSFHDVVLMKVPKQKYYSALRANHVRAMATVNAQKASQAGQQTASQFMTQTAGSDYVEASTARTLAFYQPGS